MIKTNDWQNIYSAYSPKLLGICRRYIQDVHTAEDILQDSFIAAIQNIHQLKDEKLLFAWLKKIVVNNALQHLRKSSKETFIMEEPSEITETSFAMSNIEEKSHVLAYDFTQEELLSSIDSLPHHHKSVFNLYFIENFSHAEIANQLGISINTSKSHLLRAKKSVQSYLLNTIHPETPKSKKKLTQLLVFIGFGGLLWAQTFKSKFSEFSISPSKPLEFPEYVVPKPLTVHVSSGSGISRRVGLATGGITLFIIIIASVIIFRPQAGRFFSNGNGLEPKESLSESEMTEIKTENQDHHVSNTNENYMRGQDSIEKTTSKKIEISEEIPSKIRPKGHQTANKDSLAEDMPKKVIIVKKIIQRDTIYVER